MADPKPITLTQVSEGSYDGPTPQPYVIVGTVDLDAFTSIAAPAAATTFADLAAAVTYINGLRTKLIQSGIFH